jgi:hypothetical protein
VGGELYPAAGVAPCLCVGASPEDTPIRETRQRGGFEISLWRNVPGPAAGRTLGRLSGLALTSSHEDEQDQENHDSHASDDVRHHGNHPGNIAGVGPDKADDRPHHEQRDHRSKPVQNLSPGDVLSLRPLERFAFRQAVLVHTTPAKRWYLEIVRKL